MVGYGVTFPLSMVITTLNRELREMIELPLRVMARYLCGAPWAGIHRVMLWGLRMYDIFGFSVHPICIYICSTKCSTIFLSISIIHICIYIHTYICRRVCVCVFVIEKSSSYVPIISPSPGALLGCWFGDAHHGHQLLWGQVNLAPSGPFNDPMV